MIRTNIFCTEEEAKDIKEDVDRARTTPVIAFSIADGLDGGGIAGRSWTALHKKIHALALKYGLPEIRGYYGIDLSNREFVRQ